MNSLTRTWLAISNGIALLAAIAAYAPAILAQVAPTAEPALEEITVTARKLSEIVLSVPVSVTAFSQADLEKLNISSFTD